MKTKTHFAFRVDIWDDTGDSIVEHVAGVDDFEVAEATYRAAVARWPAARITLRQGIRVVNDSEQQTGAWIQAKAAGRFIVGAIPIRAIAITGDPISLPQCEDRLRMHFGRTELLLRELRGLIEHRC
jgi:hypothetical protein